MDQELWYSGGSKVLLQENPKSPDPYQELGSSDAIMDITHTWISFLSPGFKGSVLQLTVGVVRHCQGTVTSYAAWIQNTF